MRPPLAKFFGRRHESEGTHMTNMNEVFKPGDTVPISGIYNVIHDTLDGQDHTLPHQVTAIAGEIFPPCRGCQAWVRYRLSLAAEHLEEHHHFKS